jgi:hypothetical protein
LIECSGQLDQAIIDDILAALTQFQPGTTGENSLFMLTMQGVTLLKKVERFVKKIDCASLPIHPTHLISHHPTSFCSVMSKNVSKEWCFHHTRNYSTQLVKLLTAVFEHWMERVEWVSKSNGDYYP